MPGTKRADHPARLARAVEQATSGGFWRALNPKPDGSDGRNGTTVLEPETRPPAWRRVGDLRIADKTLSGLLALAVAVSVGIHIGLTPEHLREMPRLGASFILAAVLGSAIAVALVSRPDDRRIAALAGIFCLGEILVWVLFVTVPVPLFPGTPEPVETIAIVSKLVEAVGFVLAIGLLGPLEVSSLKRAVGANLGFGLPQVEAARRPMMRRVGLGAGALAIALVILIVATSGGGSSSPSGAGGSSSPALNTGPLASLGHLQSPGPPGPIGPEGIPVPNAPPLAAAGSTARGKAIDGIPSCVHQSQIEGRKNVHLTIFVQGFARQIPAGIGIPNGKAQNTPRGTFVSAGNCFSVLHTDAADGMIQLRAPTDKTYTLGNFFDIWGQPLSRDHVGPETGPVTVLVNGQPYAGNPRNISLTDADQIQLEVGRPLVAPQTGGTATDL